MRIIIDVPNCIFKSVKDELFSCIKSLCHLLADDSIKVSKEK